jgi:hypothetical protein
MNTITFRKEDNGEKAKSELYSFISNVTPSLKWRGIFEYSENVS